MTIQIRISRAQHDEPRLGRGLPGQAHHQTQATLQGLVPHDCGLQGQMRLLLSGAALLETAPVWAVALPRIVAPCPTALRVRTGGEQHAVGVAPPLGTRMPSEPDDFSTIFLLRIVALHAMSGAPRRHAMSRRTQWLRVAGAPGFCRLGLRGLFSRRRRGDGKRKSAPACDIAYSEPGNLQAPFGTARPAVEEVPATARRLATLREEGRVRRGDQCRAWGKRRPQHALRPVGPVQRLPKLPRAGAFRVGAVATQVAEVDATA